MLSNLIIAEREASQQMLEELESTLFTNDEVDSVRASQTSFLLFFVSISLSLFFGLSIWPLRQVQVTGIVHS